MEQEASLAELCHLADGEKVDAVLIAGDVFDSGNPPARATVLRRPGRTDDRGTPGGGGYRWQP
ncbi:MAG: hypothetical protein M0Z41_12980 [Peptococcaceae bacterium]|nr:hypothetical protein [Peptococcaceae bacterium]